MSRCITQLSRWLQTPFLFANTEKERERGGEGGLKGKKKEAEKNMLDASEMPRKYENNFEIKQKK